MVDVNSYLIGYNLSNFGQFDYYKANIINNPDVITNFIYDGTSLSSLGYMICSLESNNSFDTITTDSQRTFSNVSMYGGKYMPFTISRFEDRLEFSFNIIKNICDGDMKKYNITVNECRYLKRWLSRPDAHVLKIASREYMNIYFEGSFNVQEVFYGEYRIGLSLTFITNRPFAMHEPVIFTKVFDGEPELYDIDLDLVNSQLQEDPDNEELLAEKTEILEKKESCILRISDISDEVGYVYPDIEIVCNESGHLCLTNSFDGREMIINNCTKGETIVINHNLIIGSDNPDHDIQNNFNYEFLRISNDYYSNSNNITCSLSCKVKISYSPVAKVVF